MQSMLKLALALGAKGFRVFPIQENGKLPLSGRPWSPMPTTDPEKIKRLWGTNDYNVAIACGLQDNGRYLTVADYDVKLNKKTGIRAKGDKAFALHEMLGLPTDGIRVDTPSKGWHLYFWSDEPVSNSASSIADGCDMRGQGGYVVAPGSVTDEGEYVLTSGDSIPDMPTWLIDLATTKRTKSTTSARKALSELDRPEQIEAARRWLTDEAPEAIEGSGGDEATYRVVCETRDFSISPQQCYELLLDWNEAKALPPWSPEDLHTKVRNAYAYATLPAGTKDAKGELGDVTSELYSLETRDGTERNRLYYLKFHEGADQALTVLGDPLVKGLLDSTGLSTLYGPSNSGKTFVMLDIAFHVSSGKPWQGLKVKQGLVIYFATEGGRGILKRLAALKKEHGVKDDIPLAVVPCPINLLDKAKAGDTAKLIELVKQAEADYGTKAVLIIIDTLSRALAGGDEHAPTDMGVFIRHVDRIREATTAHVALVHHSGKDIAKGMRGWSGMRAAIDTEIEINDGVLRVTKQRDMEPLKPFRLKLKSVLIGNDQDGEPVTSCVVDLTPEAAAEFDNTKSPLQENLLEALQEMRHNTPKHDVVSNAEIMEFLKTWEGREYKSLLSSIEVSRELYRLVSLSGLKKHKRGQWDIANL